MSGSIVAIGIGPGGPGGITGDARSALADSEVIVGYGPYLEMVADLIAGKEHLTTGMRHEVERCQAAIALARAGRRVAVVCSGDAGVYGMAGLILELLAEEGGAPVPVTVVPGVTAALAAAAALGAPLTNDFAVISLSDLLTPTDEIRRRLHCVAESDLVTCLYNPASTRRRALLAEAVAIFAGERGAQVPSGLVREAGRAGQTTWTGPLCDLPRDRVDMSTLVVIGNQHTLLLDGRLVTSRGYRT